MRNWPNMRTEKYVQPNPGDGRVYRHEPDGWYLIPRDGVTLRVIASIGLGWDHVSVSLANRCPTWDEMEFVRELFFRDDETVMQLSVPRSEHINQHRFCLHWWRPQHADIPRPESVMV